VVSLTLAAGIDTGGEGQETFRKREAGSIIGS